MRELEEKYIDLILKRCLNFKTGNALLIYVDLWVLMACLSSVLALTAFINYTALRDEQAMQ